MNLRRFSRRFIRENGRKNLRRKTSGLLRRIRIGRAFCLRQYSVSNTTRNARNDRDAASLFQIHHVVNWSARLGKLYFYQVVALPLHSF